jgi:methylase of polypeptide subunit release factors
VVSNGDALLQLLRELHARDYQFTVVTPATHARVLSRVLTAAPTLRDIFGWNRPFAPAELEGCLRTILDRADAIEQVDGALRSKVRVASLGGSLFLHSSYPTEQPDSVFFGPDTYRFTHFVRQHIPRLKKAKWVIDMGAGAGPGGIEFARLSPTSRVTLMDINPAAVRFSAINAAYAGVAVETLQSSAIPDGADLIIANPPYMMDESGRTYRDGGGLLGGSVALEWASQALASLAKGGTMLLYVGAAVMSGRAPLLEALQAACSKHGGALECEELDPDVFGEELEQPAYAQVERIAAVGVVITLAARNAA